MFHYHRHQLHTNSEKKASNLKLSTKPISELVSLCFAELHFAWGNSGEKMANQCKLKNCFMYLYGAAGIQG